MAALVTAMGQRQLEYQELEALKQAGDAVVPLLQAALQDEEFLFHRYGEGVLDGFALETALDLLEPFALPEAQLLIPAIRHPEKLFPKTAFYHLARCGRDDAIPFLLEALKSPSESCRTWTLMGLRFLHDSPRGTSAFRSALFEAVVPLLQDRDSEYAEQVPRALLALDVSRAIQILLAEDTFHAANPSIGPLLRALNERSVAIPAQQLRKLLAAIKTHATKYPFDYAYSDGLLLLARVEGSQAHDLAEDAQSWGNETVKTAAADAMAIAAGVEDAYGYVIALYRDQGAGCLTEKQLYYLTLAWLDAEVRNGGFSQYYFNSSGELAAHAVKAARFVGAFQLAEIIHTANAQFGEGGPHPNRHYRMDQLRKIELTVLNDLDARYYECHERLSELLSLFVAKHAASFRPTP